MSGLPFTQPDINALATWFRPSRPGEVINLLSYIPQGEHAAIQDGTSTYDATAAINDAIDSAHRYGHATVYFNGKLFNSQGGHIIYDNVQLVGLGMGATQVRLIDGVAIDTCMFVTEFYHAGMAQTNELGSGTFGFSVRGMTLNGNKQRIPRVLVVANGDHLLSATTIIVDSTAGCSAPGVLRNGSELIWYEGKTSTTFTGCVRGIRRTYAAAIADNATLEYFPLWGGVGLGLYGAQFLINDVRIENFRNIGLVKAYDRITSSSFNYQNSRDPDSSQYYDLPDGDMHATIRHIEVVNNQLCNWMDLGPHDSHASNFTIFKDGDDLHIDPDDLDSPVEDYLFPFAGLYIGSTGRPDAPIDYAAGSQYSDGHVWGNHSIGIDVATSGVVLDNVQSEGAHIQLRSQSGNVIGRALRLFGASGARSGWGAWLEYQADSIEMRTELLDYAAVVLGDPATEEDYGGGLIIVDSYTNNQSHTTLSAGIDAVVTTIPITAIVHTPGTANWLPFASNPDAGDSHLVAFGIPFDSQRGPLSVTIGDEEIRYTSQDSTHLYGCTRGYNGTVAEAHDVDDDVFGVLHIVRGETAPSFDPTRGTVIIQRQYNYEPIRTRQLESFLRRGAGLTFNEKRQALGVGAASAVTDLATKHKLFVSVTETEPANDYAVINAYGHMVRDTDAPTHTYHGMRSFLDTTFTTNAIKEGRGITGEVRVRSSGTGTKVDDAIGLHAGVFTDAASPAGVTRATALRAAITHSGTGIIASVRGVTIGTPTGAGVITTIHGLRVENQGKSGTTDSYAVRILSQSGSTNNYAILSEGGASVLMAGGTAIVPLNVRRANGQTANLLTFQDHLGAVLSYVDKDGAWNGTIGSGGSVAWSSITGKPTTVAGYGITDAVLKTGDTMSGLLSVSRDETYSGGASGSLRVQGATNTNLRVNLGFDTTASFAFIQATEFGVAARTLSLQPSAGMVAIGTTAPISTLHVASPTGATLTLERTDSTVNVDDVLGKIQWRMTDPQATTNQIAAEIEAQAPSTITTDAAAGRLIFRTTDLTVAGLPVERMRISHAGTVGIGTASPGAKLGVLATSKGDGIRIIGTGTNTPALGIYNDTTQATTFSVALEANDGMTGSAVNDAIFKNVQNAAFLIGTNNTERMRISAGGLVGIGVTLPTARLHLPAGTATANTAPLKFTSGVFLTTPEGGTMGYNGRFALTESDATRRYIVQAVASTKTTAGAPYVNDGFVTITVNGVDIKVMTTA